MYGKHFLSLLIRASWREGESTSLEIDKSSFFFVQNCGSCHPGGGFGEYDRKGNPYYNEETRKFGYESSAIIPCLMVIIHLLVQEI